ncbi:hypothetical protein [Iningainema tapete]|uniref:Uncharacterized protein n=1 Tax=Iningainema tapete BLCC-T55 TaxID=2748662 RepID=A0A8J7BXG3_9CYAN|nr:hypothetical protein [Iningainema tapete]MBD2773747.1 hypothetical protein [Iningainema tapete BLCC-T55]
MEPTTLTAAAIATLALTKAFEKTIEKFTEVALAKMSELRKKIWDKFRGNLKAETALAAAEKGSKSDLDRVAAYLQVVMNEEPEFARQIEKLAREIQQEINSSGVQGQNLQNVYGGEAEQNNAIKTNAPVIQGGSGHTITFN